MNPVDSLKTNPYLLAPMAAITDCAFRSFMRELHCGALITELLSATGLKHNSKKTLKLMRFTEEQRPLGIQIFGYSLEDLALAAKTVEEHGADFVDLNFGCPVPKVVKRGAGSAILKDLPQLTKVLKTVVSSTNLPVTIKIRTGWTQDTRNAEEVAHIAYNEGISWVAIHGRTRAQSYGGMADWNYISKVANIAKLPIIGNGDITSAQIAKNRMAESGCSGVMIGRGCLKNPWIFQEALDIEHTKNFNALLIRLQIHLEKYFEDRFVCLQLKKFSSWFSSGYRGSAKFRKDLFSLSDKSLLIKSIHDYFNSIATQSQEDTSQEDFLMGGHG